MIPRKQFKTEGWLSAAEIQEAKDIFAGFAEILNKTKDEDWGRKEHRAMWMANVANIEKNFLDNLEQAGKVTVDKFYSTRESIASTMRNVIGEFGRFFVGGALESDLKGDQRKAFYKYSNKLFAFMQKVEDKHRIAATEAMLESQERSYVQSVDWLVQQKLNQLQEAITKIANDGYKIPDELSKAMAKLAELKQQGQCLYADTDPNKLNENKSKADAALTEVGRALEKFFHECTVSAINISVKSKERNARRKLMVNFIDVQNILGEVKNDNEANYALVREGVKQKQKSNMAESAQSLTRLLEMIDHVQDAAQLKNSPEFDFEKLKKEIQAIYQQKVPRDEINQSINQQAYIRVGEFCFKACALRPTGYEAIKEMFNRAQDILAIDEKASQSAQPHMVNVLIHEFLLKGVCGRNQLVVNNVVDEFKRRGGAEIWNQVIKQLNSDHPLVKNVRAEIKNNTTQLEALTHFMSEVEAKRNASVAPTTVKKSLRIIVPTTPVSSRKDRLSEPDSSRSRSTSLADPSVDDPSHNRSNSMSSSKESVTPSMISSISESSTINPISRTSALSPSQSTSNSQTPSVNSVSRSISSLAPTSPPNKVDPVIVKVVERMIKELQDQYKKAVDGLAKKSKVLPQERDKATKQIAALNNVIRECQESISDVSKIQEVIKEAKKNPDFRATTTKTGFWKSPSVSDILSGYEKMLDKPQQAAPVHQQTMKRK